MVTKEKIKRGLKWIGAGVALIILLLSGARFIQVYMQSQFNGERGPYLQMLGSDRVTIRWQSNNPIIGRVKYGKGELLTQSTVELEEREEHEVQILGLVPGTHYSYQITGNEETYRFVTAPIVGESDSVRLWVQGDPGYYSQQAIDVNEQAMRWMKQYPRAARPLFDLWLTTGDNAYKSGKQVEFQKELFVPYSQLLSRYPYWPVYGNHDARRWSFFNIFTFPEDGELGGVASGTEHYFSFDYGQLHLVYLDTETEALGRDDEMAQWLKKDLSENKQQWTLALFHHPPYTKGTHNSDDTWEGLGDRWDSMGRMTRVREELLPILEEGGVDMVISGHSHVYERSYQLRGHYGFSPSLNDSMIIDRDNCLLKDAGTNYLVVGSSAKGGAGRLNHPAMKFSTAKSGSQVIDIEPGRLTSTFIDNEGVVLDQFMIVDSGDTKKEGSIDCPL